MWLRISLSDISQLQQQEQQEQQQQQQQQKSHTCEEDGTHPRISFWYLLMNLKNKYIFI